MGKSLVEEGAGEEDVYEKYLGTLGGLNIPYDEVSEKIKHKISHINNRSTPVLCEFDFVDAGFPTGVKNLRGRLFKI